MSSNKNEHFMFTDDLDSDDSNADKDYKPSEYEESDEEPTGIKILITIDLTVHDSMLLILSRGVKNMLSISDV